MAISLIPDQLCDSIYELDGEALQKAGIRLILADLDNTISPYSVSEPTEDVREWHAMLMSYGLSLFIVSNNRSKTRIKHYCSLLDVPFIDHAGKPRRAPFFQAMKQMGVTPKETIMVGDQVFTDVLGAKNAGIKVILVEPIELRDNLFRRLRHFLEQPIIAIARHRQSRTAKGQRDSQGDLESRGL